MGSVDEYPITMNIQITRTNVLLQPLFCPMIGTHQMYIFVEAKRCTYQYEAMQSMLWSMRQCKDG